MDMLSILSAYIPIGRKGSSSRLVNLYVSVCGLDESFSKGSILFVNVSS